MISTKEYGRLSEDEQYFYDPQYRHYKVKKVRGYENCDLGHTHFMGWVEERTPIGDPYQYIRDNSLIRSTMFLMKNNIADKLNNSNVLAERMLSKPSKWKKQ